MSKTGCFLLKSLALPCAPPPPRSWDWGVRAAELLRLTETHLGLRFRCRL